MKRIIWILLIITICLTGCRSRQIFSELLPQYLLEWGRDKGLTPVYREYYTLTESKLAKFQGGRYFHEKFNKLRLSTNAAGEFNYKLFAEKECVFEMTPQREITNISILSCMSEEEFNALKPLLDQVTIPKDAFGNIYTIMQCFDNYTYIYMKTTTPSSLSDQRTGLFKNIVDEKAYLFYDDKLISDETFTPENNIWHIYKLR